MTVVREIILHSTEENNYQQQTHLDVARSRSQSSLVQPPQPVLRFIEAFEQGENGLVGVFLGSHFYLGVTGSVTILIQIRMMVLEDRRDLELFN